MSGELGMWRRKWPFVTVVDHLLLVAFAPVAGRGLCRPIQLSGNTAYRVTLRHHLDPFTSPCLPWCPQADRCAGKLHSLLELFASSAFSVSQRV